MAAMPMQTHIRLSAPEQTTMYLDYSLFGHFSIWAHGLSYNFASGSEITLCNKIDIPLVVYRFTGNVMTSIATLRA